ncbi:MAG: DNA circularization protein [Desulfobulbia bacterium]
MSWRDTIKGRSEGGVPLVGSFRGAKFIVPDSDATFGRRAEVHEYPRRDTPWVEDLGRKARQFSIEVFVDGRLGDYLAARDALIAALEEKGSATLVHPWYGSMTVSLAEPAGVRESTREGGRATFRLAFVEAGELRFPTSGVDTATVVDKQASATLTSMIRDFIKNFNVDGLPAWSLAEIERDLYGALAEVEGLISGVAGAIAGEIRTPGNMAAGIIGAIQRLRGIAPEPLQAVGLYKRLFAAGEDNPTVPATTAVREQQVQNSAAVQRLTQQTAVVEAARSASQADYPARDEALATAAMLQEALDVQMEAVEPVTGAPISDPVYQALAALRAAVSIDLRTRGARLPELTGYTPGTTLPALVIAHRLYGDATRADEITDRNRIRHPGFVPGGETLEVVARDGLMSRSAGRAGGTLAHG